MAAPRANSLGDYLRAARGQGRDTHPSEEVVEPRQTRNMDRKCVGSHPIKTRCACRSSRTTALCLTDRAWAVLIPPGSDRLGPAVALGLSYFGVALARCAQADPSMSRRCSSVVRTWIWRVNDERRTLMKKLKTGQDFRPDFPFGGAAGNRTRFITIADLWKRGV